MMADMEEMIYGMVSIPHEARQVMERDILKAKQGTAEDSGECDKVDITNNVHGECLSKVQ